ncbi:DUF5074 domain-containing protein [Pedobacter nyackensis]|uniref:DUF5074 domain-containing protein n=1 Tax=Pedobacter nyackensis TaxID=475255 RepID=UPI00292FBCAE|nr:DUF5074 domain-containing protein [Pedobacter nyackensis]
MNTITLKKTALVLVIASALFSCKKDDTVKEELSVSGKYEDGFFVINEGWMGHGTGSVSFFDNASGTLKDSVFQKENPNSEGFKPTSSTVQFAAKFNNNLYVVSKVRGPVVVADAKTLKEVGRIPGSSEYDWRAFVGLDENRGLLSSTDGIYMVNLKTLKPSFKLLGANGQTGDMLKAGKYIYAINQSAGAIIYNAEDLSVVKKIAGVTLGFVQTPNKKVWYTKKEYLYSSDPQTLETDSVKLPFTPANTWFAWFSSPIIASTKDNTIFLLKAPSFGGGKMLYKYTEGDKSTLDQPFITTPENQSFYKKNLGYNPKTNQIVTTTVQDGWGDNYKVNNIYFYDAVTGSLIKQIPYSGFYFPAMFVFH